jgi:hypothetical protein
MNQRQLASVLFAAVGLFIAGSHFPEILMYAAVFRPSTPDPDGPASAAGERLFWVLGLMSSLLGILVGSVLVLLRNRLANRLFPPANELVSSREVQAVALSILGCYFAVQGMSRLAVSGHFSWSDATELVLGVGLFFGARGLSRLWSFGRSAGYQGSVGDGGA